jgi:hypothetical protein
MKPPTLLAGIATLAGAVLLAGLPVCAESGEAPDLSGSWELNERLSENPRDKMRETMQQRGGGPPGGMGGGGRGGGMGGGGRGGGPDGGIDPETMRRRGQELEQAARSMTIIQADPELTIIQADPELTIVYADGRERRLYADGREHRREGGTGEVETKTKWKKDGRLVVRSTTERGQEIKETFRHAPGESRLYVTTEVKGDGRMPGIEFERVYDRAVAEPDDS